MAYKALYRTWRPKVFEDLIGQDQIIKTLKNQISSSQIGHAYLFTGTRGTGKTSTAKVFAKAVNCESKESSNPCNLCSTCIGIEEERIMDVMEIDAASNNGVENVREIRENVKYHPSKGRYKVYIIDEVHMLSQGAFNALLKTLEEPPKHVIFILATTEPRKIPATILSRCQRYDFKPVSIENIVKRLRFVMEQMGLSYDEEALRIVAVSAEGALRDGLSILEQTLDKNEPRLTAEKVMKTLGIVKDEALYQMVESLKLKKLEQLLKGIDENIMEGKDPLNLARDLQGYFRKLLMVKIGVAPENISTMPSVFLEKIKTQSGSLSKNWIIKNMEELSELEGKLRWSSQPRVQLEVHFIKGCKEEELYKEEVKEELRVEAQKKAEQPILNAREKKVVVPHKEKEEEREREDKEDIEERRSDKTIGKQELWSLWPKVLQLLKKNKKAQLEALLKEGKLKEFDGKKLTIVYDPMYSFHREAMDKADKKKQVEEIIHQLSGASVSLSLIIKENTPQRVTSTEETLKRILPDGILEISDE